jgi:hypothetical protein
MKEKFEIRNQKFEPEAVLANSQNNRAPRAPNTPNLTVITEDKIDG